MQNECDKRTSGNLSLSNEFKEEIESFFRYKKPIGIKENNVVSTDRFVVLLVTRFAYYSLRIIKPFNL